MSLSDELARLGELHQRGVITDAEFDRAKARVLNGAAGCASAPLNTLNTLRRSRADSWLGGVCGGLAQATGTATWLWRVAFTLFVLCAGSGGFVYLLLWFFVPLENPGVEPAPHLAETSP
jgi:phage shock protein C